MGEDTAVIWLKELWDKQEPFEKFIQPEQFEQAMSIERDMLLNVFWLGRNTEILYEDFQKVLNNKIYNK